jgi:hypothetical protein
MNPEQVQEVVMQTLRDVMTAGDLVMEGNGMECQARCHGWPATDGSRNAANAARNGYDSAKWRRNAA